MRKNKPNDSGKNVECWGEDFYFFFVAAFFAGAFFAGAFFAGVLAAAFFAAAIGIHLPPERVIFCVNLAINKYFGRNGFLEPGITANLYFFQRKLVAFGRKRNNQTICYKKRNPSFFPRFGKTKKIMIFYKM